MEGLAAAIPEPPLVALLGTGFVLLVGFERARRCRRAGGALI